MVDAILLLFARAYAGTSLTAIPRSHLQRDVRRILSDRLPDTVIPEAVVEHYVRQLNALIDEQRSLNRPA